MRWARGRIKKKREKGLALSFEESSSNYQLVTDNTEVEKNAFKHLWRVFICFCDKTFSGPKSIWPT